MNTPLTTLSVLLLSAAPAWSAAPNAAEAELKDADGKKVGTATFLQTPTGVELSIRASGLTPGAHGIHIHQNGKCDGPDFKSAGEHLAGAPVQGEAPSHGLKKEVPHAGDLPNLKVGEDGTVTAEMRTEGFTLQKSASSKGAASTKSRSLLKEGGTAIVIHEKSDDQRTDPAGGSGARIACGVIKPKASGSG